MAHMLRERDEWRRCRGCEEVLLGTELEHASHVRFCQEAQAERQKEREREERREALRLERESNLEARKRKRKLLVAGSAEERECLSFDGRADFGWCADEKEVALTIARRYAMHEGWVKARDLGLRVQAEGPPREWLVGRLDLKLQGDEYLGRLEMRDEKDQLMVFAWREGVDRQVRGLCRSN